jgi:hypothetical protein
MSSKLNNAEAENIITFMSSKLNNAEAGDNIIGLSDTLKKYIIVVS